jgi:hypothetical protein
MGMMGRSADASPAGGSRGDRPAADARSAAATFCVVGLRTHCANKANGTRLDAEAPSSRTHKPPSTQPSATPPCHWLRPLLPLKLAGVTKHSHRSPGRQSENSPLPPPP